MAASSIETALSIRQVVGIPGCQARRRDVLLRQLQVIQADIQPVHTPRIVRSQLPQHRSRAASGFQHPAAGA